MKLLNLLLFVMLCSTFSYGQQANNHTTQSAFNIFKLGDSMIKFNRQVGCADAFIADTIACRSFRYLPAEKDSIQVGAINFSIVFLFPDDYKRITSVELIKQYVLTDSGSIKELEKLAKSNYSSLVKLITEKMKLKSDKYPNNNMLSMSEEGRTWEKNNILFTLRLEKLKIKKATLKYIIDFSYGFKQKSI